MTTAFQSNAFQNNAFQITIAPVVITQQPAGGDSTLLRKRGRRPKYFWEAAQLKKKPETRIAEAVFDAVADAYLIESDSEFFTQVKYLQKLERRLEETKFFELAKHVEMALKDLAYRAEIREQEASEERELNELLELI